MKKIKSIACFVACVTALSSVMTYAPSANAESEMVYGTMNIPYADFYCAELEESVNKYDVDAVSSATTGKWAKNGEGELVAGTYNQPNEDGSGKILGVTYNVAIDKETLDALGENNYGFAQSTEIPAVYKTVTLEDGKAVFSAVNDQTPEQITLSATLGTTSAWGDYILKISDKPENMGTVYGFILKTESNENYAMRHLENIWRDEIAWSSGFKKQEAKGNTLCYENYIGIMGETISEIKYITENGYYTAQTNIYVPVKFDGTVTAENADVSAGETSFATTGFPEDYKMAYSADGLEATVENGKITYSNAVPGLYTLNINDADGKYAPMSATFTLSTYSLPVSFENEKIVKTSSATDDEASNFIKNISVVSVNGTDYKATGKGSVKIFDENGVIDMSAASKNANVFEGSDSYTVVVTATGYNKPLEFTVKAVAQTTTTTAVTTTVQSTTTAKTTTAQSTTTAKTTTTAKKTSSSPATGDSGAAIPAMMLALAGISAFIFKKKHK